MSQESKCGKLPAAVMVGRERRVGKLVDQQQSRASVLAEPHGGDCYGGIVRWWEDAL